MTKNALNPKFIASVRNLSKSFYQVIENWDERHDEVNPLGEQGCYPFQFDLEEVQCQVQSWAERLETHFGATSEVLEIGAAEYEYGVWTPWADVICVDCHNDKDYCHKDHFKKIEKSIAKVLEDQYATTPCDQCGKLIQMSDDIANEHNLVLALKKVGIHAEMAQTGGMCDALYVTLTDGNQYMLKYDEEEGKNYFFISEWDTEGEWLDRSQVEGSSFETIQEAVNFLFTESRVSKEHIAGWSELFTPYQLRSMIVERLKTGTLNGFESKATGQWVENPLYDETMRFEVNPFEHYGEESITLALIPWSPDDDDKPIDEVENLKAINQALEAHVISFLDDFDKTGEYNERFDLKITIGDKTFNLPLGAQLSEDFKAMIQTEIDDLEG